MFLTQTIKKRDETVYTRTDKLVDGRIKYDKLSANETYYVLRTILEPAIYTREFTYSTKEQLTYSVRDDL